MRRRALASETDGPPLSRVGRRAFLAGGAAVLVARPAHAAPRREGDVLDELLRREDAAAFAYGAAPVAVGPDLATHEAEHAAALRTMLEGLTREIPPVPADVPALNAPARRLADASDGQRIDAAIALEATLISAYRGALLELEEPGMVATIGTILASHAQHRALLLREAGGDPFS